MNFFVRLWLELINLFNMLFDYFTASYYHTVVFFIIIVLILLFVICKILSKRKNIMYKLFVEQYDNILYFVSAYKYKTKDESVKSLFDFVDNNYVDNIFEFQKYFLDLEKKTWKKIAPQKEREYLISLYNKYNKFKLWNKIIWFILIGLFILILVWFIFVL